MTREERQQVLNNLDKTLEHSKKVLQESKELLKKLEIAIDRR